MTDDKACILAKEAIEEIKRLEKVAKFVGEDTTETQTLIIILAIKKYFIERTQVPVNHAHPNFLDSYGRLLEAAKKTVDLYHALPPESSSTTLQIGFLKYAIDKAEKLP